MSLADSSVVRYTYQLDTGGNDGLEFPIPFPFMDAAEIHVLAERENGTQSTLYNYTVSGGNNGTGTITFDAEISNVYASLTIWRVTALSQLLDLNYNEGITLALIEAALDKLTRAAQELRHQRNVLGFPVTENASAYATLPAPAARADKVMYFNSGGELELLPLATFKALLDAV